MGRYRKKPVEIEAKQWDGTAECATEIIDWALSSNRTARYHDDQVLMIDTLEGTMSALPGDWIIKGVRGEIYPCKPAIFQETYEEVKTSLE